MGLFAERPEEPTDWAGLPSEPESERELTREEFLRDAPADWLPFLQGDDPLACITVPVASTLPAEPGAAPAPDADAPGA